MLKITTREIEKFRKLGLLDEIAYRNYKIRKEFHRRRNISKYQKPIQIKTDLAAEYFLSIDTVHKAIYKLNKHKNQTFPKE